MTTVIKKLDVNGLRVSEPVNAAELENIMKTITDKLNEVIEQVNKLSYELDK